MTDRHNVRVLAVAGWDPTLGAGLGADLATISAAGASGVGVVTALVPQGRSGVKSLRPVAVPDLLDQLEAALGEGPVDAVKVGLMPDHAAIVALAAFLADRLADVPTVVDPIMGATAGGWSLDRRGRMALLDVLAPCAGLLVPNASEARRWVADSTARATSSAEAGHFLLERTQAGAVLVTGGDEGTTYVEDVLCLPNGSTTAFRAQRIPGGPFHGTGCALSAHIAVELARGMDLVAAIGAATHAVRARIALAAERGSWCLPTVAPSRG